MKMKFSVLSVCMAIAFLSVATFAFAQNYQPAGDKWIVKWWGPGLVIKTGGFANSAKIDYMSEGTGGKLTNASVSTPQGVGRTKNTPLNLASNGGALPWKVITIDPKDQNNMSTSHGLKDQTDVTWHGVIAIISPNDRKTKIHPAHDDHAEIWLNGDKVYDNPAWTGAVEKVTKPTDVQLKKGENYLHFKCGESGGADYVNLHFEAGDADLKVAPTTDDKFLEVLTAVEAKGKLTTTWGSIKGAN